MALVKLWNSWQNGRCQHQMSAVRLKSKSNLQREAELDSRLIRVENNGDRMAEFGQANGS